MEVRFPLALASFVISSPVFRHLHELGASVYPACTCPSRQPSLTEKKGIVKDFGV